MLDEADPPGCVPPGLDGLLMTLPWPIYEGIVLFLADARFVAKAARMPVPRIPPAAGATFRFTLRVFSAIGMKGDVVSGTMFPVDGNCKKRSEEHTSELQSHSDIS